MSFRIIVVRVGKVRYHSNNAAFRSFRLASSESSISSFVAVDVRLVAGVVMERTSSHCNQTTKGPVQESRFT